MERDAERVGQDRRSGMDERECNDLIFKILSVPSEEDHQFRSLPFVNPFTLNRI